MHTLSHIKIIFLATCCFLFASVSDIFAANELEKRVTLQAVKTPLSKLLESITKQTNIRFSYSPQMVNVNQKISCSIRHKELKMALDTILSPSIEYKLVAKHIVLSPAKKSLTKAKPPQPEYKYTINEPEPAIASKIEESPNAIILKTEEEMKNHLAALLISAPLVVNPVVAQVEQTASPDKSPKTSKSEIRRKKPLQATFFYPIGSDGANSAENEYNISFNVLGGVTGNLVGIEIGGLFNANQYSSQGIQIAGVFNATGFSAIEEFSNNVQFAGVLNYTQSGYSTQFAGAANIGDRALIQIGGIMNFSSETLFQLGGITNITGRNLVQLGGIANFSTESRFQTAGIINITGKGQVQLGGIANIARVSSCQIGGLTNITKQGKFQMGLVNIRDTDDGVSLGLVNIVKQGGTLDFGIEGGDFIQIAPTFRSGVKKLYTFLGVGYNFSDNFWAVGAGLGSTIDFSKRWALDLEAIQYLLYKNFKKLSQYNGLLQFRPMINFSITNQFKIYLGPSLNLLILQENNNLNCNVPYDFYNRTINNKKISSWVGIVGGVKF